MNPFDTQLTNEDYADWFLRLIADGHNTRSANRHIKKRLRKSITI